jgi:hypothetical protein
MKVWKAFIEYDNINSAVEAKRNLDDFLLFSDGSRINIYFSNLDSIKFQNNNSGGMGNIHNISRKSLDYTQPESQNLAGIVDPQIKTIVNPSFNSERSMTLPPSLHSNGLDFHTDKVSSPLKSQFHRQMKAKSMEPNPFSKF